MRASVLMAAVADRKQPNMHMHFPRAGDWEGGGGEEEVVVERHAPRVRRRRYIQRVSETVREKTTRPRTAVQTILKFDHTWKVGGDKRCSDSVSA